MRSRLVLVVALVFSSLGALFQAAPAGAATTTVSVTRAAMGSWKDTASGTAAGSFVAGVGAPSGKGAYQMTTGPGTTTAGGSQLLTNSAYAGTAIADLTALTYSSLEGFENPNDVVAPYLRIPVTGTDGAGNAVSTTLVFEPYYSTTAFGGSPTGQHPIALGQWQGWDALAGKWWVTATAKPICPANCFVDWATVKNAIPDGVIASPGITIGAGQGSAGAPWANFRGLVDNLTIGVGADAATFDFEPVVTLSRLSSLAGWGAETVGAPGITFNDGPSAPANPVPLGAGSVQWASVPQPRSDLVQAGWNNQRVSAITALSYNTFVSTPGSVGGNPSEVAPYLHIDCRVCGTTLGGSLVFEPVYQRPQTGQPNQSAVQVGAWQHWDARTGQWWFSGEAFKLQTLDQWLAQYPLMTINGVHIGADGRDPWAGFAGAVDAFNIRINGAEATYDFDPEKPAITSFTPASGPAGTSVTINGVHLTGATGVVFNDLEVVPTSVTASTVTATVPVGATTGVITVKTPAGAVISSSNFVTGNDGLVKYEETNPAFDFTQSAGWTVLNDAKQSAGRALINPNTGSFADVGFTGSTIHWVGLRGPNTAVAAVAIDGGPATTVDTYAPVYEGQQVLFSATGITPGNHTMRITYTGKNAAAATTSYIVVDAIETQTFTPSISSFTPASGPPGTTVQISGAHLDGVNDVKFGGATASFTVNSPSSITATVPSAAVTGPITVTAGTESASSATPFTVEAAPAVTLVRHEAESDSIFDFSKSSGWFRWNDTATGGGQSGGAAMLNSASGSFVDVTFTGAIAKWVGLKGPNTAIGLVSIDGVGYGTVDTYAASYSAKQVLFSKTDLPAGVHTMRITYSGKNAAAAATSYLVVDAVDTAPVAGTITKFSPVGGPVGTPVTITGSNLASTTAVRFNGTSTSTFTVNPAGTQITVNVPAGATTGLISITSPGGTTNSLSRFTVGPTVLNRIEETSTAFTFGSGQGWFSWSDTTTGGGESGGAAMLTPTSGAFVDVTFTGDTVNFVGLRGPNTAIAAITIDGVGYGSVDTYAPTYTAQQVLFSKTGLAAGTHTLRISYAGKNASAAATSYLAIDAIEAGGV